MRKFRIVTTINPYNYENETDLVYTVQMFQYECLLSSWVNIKSYTTLEKAKEAIDHLNKPDIYDKGH